MTDEFPELFEGFEEDVNIEDFEEYSKLRKKFIDWLSHSWINSAAQERGLRVELKSVISNSGLCVYLRLGFQNSDQRKLGEN